LKPFLVTVCDPGGGRGVTTGTNYFWWWEKMELCIKLKGVYSKRSWTNLNKTRTRHSTAIKSRNGKNEVNGLNYFSQYYLDPIDLNMKQIYMVQMFLIVLLNIKILSRLRRKITYLIILCYS